MKEPMTAEQINQLETYDGVKEVLAEMSLHDNLVRQVFRIGEARQLERGHIYALLALHAIRILREQDKLRLDEMNARVTPPFLGK